MSRNKSCSDAEKHPYQKRGFYLKLENQFWMNSQLYSEKTKNKMSELVESFYHQNSLLLNIIDK